MHREAVGSAGSHLFQELSTLGQQFVQTLLFREGLGRIEPVLPASTSRPGQPFGGARSGSGTAVHTASKDLGCALDREPPC
jgi:hypothetical protein